MGDSIANLGSALLETFLVIFLGYVFGKTRLITSTQGQVLYAHVFTSMDMKVMPRESICSQGR
jgi:membrane protein DedA with SNARE-associated domain